MKYTEFKDSIREELKRNPSGLTWRELKGTLALPYERPCSEWTSRLEKEIGLVRREKKGNALIWRLGGRER
jgi:hypothetical protein